MKTVEERLKFLETRLRRYQGLTMLIGIVLVALVTISASPTIPEVIKARKFEVVNPEGVTVAVLKSWALGGWLDIRSNKGTRTTHIAQNDEGGGFLAVYSEEGNEVINLSLGEQTGNGLISVNSAKGIKLVSISSGTGTGNGAILILSKEGKELISIGSDVTGHGQLVVKSMEGKGYIYLGANKDDTGGYVVVDNKTGESVVTLGADAYGNGEVGAWNRKGMGRTLKPGP